MASGIIGITFIIVIIELGSYSYFPFSFTWDFKSSMPFLYIYYDLDDL